MATNPYQKKLEDDISSFFSEKTFLKIKNNAFGIGMVYFFFGTMDEHKKLASSIECYLPIADALRLCDNIIFGKIRKKADAEKAKGEKYPQAIWDSGLGGVNEKKAKERKLRNDGRAVSRIFDLAPGSVKPYVFTATQRPGSSNEKGLIVPDYKCDKADILTIRVPVIDDAELENMAQKLKLEIYSYQAAKYVHYYPFDEQTSDTTRSEESKPANRNTNNGGNSHATSDDSASSNNSEKPAPANTTDSQAGSTPADTSAYSTIKLLAKTAVQEVKNSDKLCMQCMDEDSRIYNVVFEKDTVDRVNADKWAQFKAMAEVCASQPFCFYMLYEKGNLGKSEVLLFRGFPKTK